MESQDEWVKLPKGLFSVFCENCGWQDWQDFEQINRRESSKCPACGTETRFTVSKMYPAGTIPVRDERPA